MIRSLSNATCLHCQRAVDLLRLRPCRRVQGWVVSVSVSVARDGSMWARARALSSSQRRNRRVAPCSISSAAISSCRLAMASRSAGEDGAPHAPPWVRPLHTHQFRRAYRRVRRAPPSARTRCPVGRSGPCASPPGRGRRRSWPAALLLFAQCISVYKHMCLGGGQPPASAAPARARRAPCTAPAGAPSSC
jgi:hypothetical protein